MYLISAFLRNIKEGLICTEGDYYIYKRKDGCVKLSFLLNWNVFCLNACLKEKYKALFLGWGGAAFAVHDFQTVYVSGVYIEQR